MRALVCVFACRIFLKYAVDLMLRLRVSFCSTLCRFVPQVGWCVPGSMSVGDGGVLIVGILAHFLFATS